VSTWPKIICDPIHRIIPFEDKPWDRLALRLIDTPEFQRLRRIKQLGMADLVFPGATHTRFAHSLGVFHLARRMLNRLDEVAGKQQEQYTKTCVLSAALLHDVGHGPFSHAFEKVTHEDHERRTREVILSPATRVHQVLAAEANDLPAAVAAFFEAAPATNEASHAPPRYLRDLVSSQLDADRFDYLLRDAWATGAEFGRFDLEYILANLNLDSTRGRIHLNGKAQSAAESYVEARAHMYRAVYYHKTIRAAEVMLRLALQRYQALLVAAATEEDRLAVVPGVRAAVRVAFTGKGLPLAGYLALDDVAITDFLQAARASADATLRDLAAGIVERNLWKTLDLSGKSSQAVGKFCAAYSQRLAADGHDPNAVVVSDAPGDTPYKLYDPDATEPATQIYVGPEASTANELTRLASHVQQLARRYELTRYHYRPDLRATMDQVYENTVA
jgi:HD superfamily phosphohydrolase